MSGEIQFRSSVFGGFNKSDVIDYIEKLQALHNGLRDGFQTQNNELSKALVYVKQLEERLVALNLENKELKEKNREYSQKLTDDTEQIGGEKSGKPTDIDIGCDRLKKVESQIGALLLDAVIYSDRMTEEAKEAAKNITSDAKNTIITTVEDVNRLGVEICMLSENFSDTLSKMIDKVEDLSKNLTAFASKFDKNIPDGPELPAASERSGFFHHIDEYNRSVDNDADKGAQRADKEFSQAPSLEDSEKGFILSFERYNDEIEEESATEPNDAPDGEAPADIDREIIETMQSDEEENELIESLMQTHVEDEFDDTTVLSRNEPETHSEADDIVIEEPDTDPVEDIGEAAAPENEEKPENEPAEIIGEADEIIVEEPDTDLVEDTEEAAAPENEEKPENEPAETIGETDEIIVEEPDTDIVEDSEAEAAVPENEEEPENEPAETIGEADEIIVEEPDTDLVEDTEEAAVAENEEEPENEPAETIGETDEIIVEEPDTDIVEDSEAEAAVLENEEEPENEPAETIGEADEIIVEEPDTDLVEDTEEAADAPDSEEEPENEPAETIGETDEIIVEEPDTDLVEDTEEAADAPESDEDDDLPEDGEDSGSEHKKEYMQILEKKPLIDERLKIPTSREIEDLIGFFSGNK